MKIAIDARWIFPEISGIGSYTRELIAHLAELDADNDYTILFSDQSLLDRTVAETRLAHAKNFRTLRLPFGVFSVRNQFQLPGLIAKHGFDIFHSTNYMIPFAAFPRHRRGRTASVVTIHDVIPMIFPHHAPRSRKSRMYPLYRRIMLEVGARADAIITDSDASRNDILKHLLIAPEEADKVKSIHLGVSGGSIDSAGAQDRAARAGNCTRQILYVGRFDPYKNVPVLVEAFAAAKKQCPFPISLVIVGQPDPRYPEASQLADRLGLADAVSWTGYLSDAELAAAYAGADLLVHPSRYEGFGLQVADAMACGLPVVCSNGGSLAEIAGDAAIVLDPDDVRGFGDAIVRVLSTPSLAADLSARGKRRASGFSWRKTAEKTLALYESLGRTAGA